MDLDRLRCFVAAADELHFGRAAQALGVLPAALGRNIRRLEDDLNVALFQRTTRSVSLTPQGAELLEDARRLLAQSQAFLARARAQGRLAARKLRVGVIDTAAAGLMPMLLKDFRADHPGVEVQLIDDKSIRLLPRLISGGLDVAVLRPPERPVRALSLEHLLYETPVVAIPVDHRLARRRSLPLDALANEPLIVPDRRSRPHSHDLTVKLLAQAGVTARIGQVADEKQTIVTLVAARIGLAIVPRWTSRLGVKGVAYVPIAPAAGLTLSRLPMSLATLRDARDPIRDLFRQTLFAHLPRYAAQA